MPQNQEVRPLLKIKKLPPAYNWLGEKIQKVSSEIPVPARKHVFTAEFKKTGEDKQTLSATGMLTRYIDMKQVGQADIMTHPGFFSLTGEGLCVGRDSTSPVSPDYKAPFRFTGGIN